MNHYIKTKLFLLLCLIICFTGYAAAQVNAESEATDASDNYTFESIDVPGVDFLAVAASSDFEDYAGYTLSADGQKKVAFTLIDGVFQTYDFPGAKNTYFFALGNNGNAAGHYEDNAGCTVGSFWKMANSDNTIFRGRFKPNSTVSVIRRGH